MGHTKSMGFFVNIWLDPSLPQQHRHWVLLANPSRLQCYHEPARLVSHTSHLFPAIWIWTMSHRRAIMMAVFLLRHFFFGCHCSLWNVSFVSLSLSIKKEKDVLESSRESMTLSCETSFHLDFSSIRVENLASTVCQGWYSPPNLFTMGKILVLIASGVSPSGCYGLWIWSYGWRQKKIEAC